MPEIESTGGAAVPMASESTKDQLAANIQSKFDAVFSDEPDETPTETVDETPAESTETETETPATETETTETAAESAAETKTPTTEAAAKKALAGKAPTLPAAYRRSLKAMEWTDEEIDSAAADPKFLTIAAKVHQTRNKEVAAWAELGRRTKESQAQTSAQTTPTKEATKPAFQAFSDAEVAKLKETYGDEAGGLIDALVGRVNPLIEQMQRALPIVEQTQARSQQAQADMLVRQIDGFFGGKELDPYKDSYGTSASKLTDTQNAQRTKVLEYADALIGGAAQQGRQLTFDEAMSLAHDAVSGGLKEQAARKQITSQLQTRAKGVTLKPGSRPAAPLNDKGKLEQRVKGSLSKLFV